MSLTQFHPVVQRWFSESIGTPTAAQNEGWAAIREGRHTLIAAPTGSGKTLAAFLTALDDLFLEKDLPDETRVVYVSPLKALSADIHKNLAEPRRGIRKLAEEMGVESARITAAVRTGDTTQSERAAMLRKPPHILVTTPESLYLLLTAERSRAMLRAVRTVIVDEIHAVIGTRRGAHLALTLERLQQVVSGPLLRLGLSATQKPIETVARYLVGTNGGDCAIVNHGHRREMDLAIELPNSPLQAVMALEVWEEYYDRLTALVADHRTTLVFVNTRRMAERIARHLTDRLGEDAVTAHHGSLAKEKRLDAEARLKEGRLKALIATASLELGIDIGNVDLVCQIGSPHRIATFLQRVGRSGHTVSGTPKGRLFPVSRDDLVECAALLSAVRKGELDAIVEQTAPLDVLAQQMVAECSSRECSEDDLFGMTRRAWPYRQMTRDCFDAVVKMVAEGFATRRGRRSALVHRDEVNGVVRGRRGSRSLAITSGGAIPEVADYRVVLEPEEIFIGTLNEDFAIESMQGDVFQLGNASWQITQVGTGVVRVIDAHGAPPNIPFWFGEAPARSDELSSAVSDLRRRMDGMLGSGFRVPGSEFPNDEASLPNPEPGTRNPEPVEWLAAEANISEEAARQIADYLSEAKRALGVLPTQDTLVMERFFDEAGGMQVVLHAPFGSRVNKAWGLALRKRFCRQFNFELQAAATEDAVLLSLGPQHSFPLQDLFRYLHPNTAREVLIQAFLDAPVWKTRWRWNTTIALAVPRNRGGTRIAPQLQRMLADDLMAAVFPDATACLENVAGDRKIPDHPLVNQAIEDCLQEAMDFEGLAAVLDRIHEGKIECVARDLPEPSALSHDILNARPYAFLDDAPLEERRTQAVATGRSTTEMGALDPAAIARVRNEAAPDPRDADELHDALLTAGFLTVNETSSISPELFDALVISRRAALVHDRWIAAERLPELQALMPVETTLVPPPSRASRTWTREEALVELIRGRMTLLGPATATDLAASLQVDESETEAALLKLEGEGVILRGSFTRRELITHHSSLITSIEWCDRRLLARIHRYTLNRLRAEIEPVTPADFMRFLFDWQHAGGTAKLTGVDGLRAVITALDGYEAAAEAWERFILPARVDRYESTLLDMLCLTGEIGWARVSPAETSPVGSTPIALFFRENSDAWLCIRNSDSIALSEPARRVLETLRSRGASFARDLAADEQTLGELVSAGLIASDSFAGLRALTGRGKLAQAGRWFVLDNPEQGTRHPEADLEVRARALLRRYGVVFRRLLAREAHGALWRDLARVYRRWEARGEIRGGRFVAGMSGEQFALPEAVQRLREIRREGSAGEIIAISAADPLNLCGIITPGERVRATPGTRIAFRDGNALYVMEGDYLRPLAPVDPSTATEIATLLAGRRVSAISGFVGRQG